MAALEHVRDVAGFLDAAVGALGLEIDRVFADHRDAWRGALAEELEIVGHGRGLGVWSWLSQSGRLQQDDRGA